MYYNRTLPLPDLFGSGIYLGASLEAGRMSNPFAVASTNGTVLSGSVFLGADTFIGPAYLGMGFGEKGRFTLYMMIGVP
jgi:NTE family protein